MIYLIVCLYSNIANIIICHIVFVCACVCARLASIQQRLFKVWKKKWERMEGTEGANLFFRFSFSLSLRNFRVVVVLSAFFTKKKKDVTMQSTYSVRSSASGQIIHHDYAYMTWSKLHDMSVDSAQFPTQTLCWLVATIGIGGPERQLCVCVCQSTMRIVM